MCLLRGSLLLWLSSLQMGERPDLAQASRLGCVWRLRCALADVPGALQVMLGVDRLDMIKGIPQKLLAFEKFLEEHPQWRDKVLLVQIAVPSRTDVPEYQVPSPLFCGLQAALIVCSCLLCVILPQASAY